jgi:hypothetical protein
LHKSLFPFGNQKIRPSKKKGRIRRIRDTTLIPTGIAVHGHSQRTNIRVSCNGDRPYALNDLLQRFSSGRIFLFGTRPVRTNHRLSAQLFQKVLVPIIRFHKGCEVLIAFFKKYAYILPSFPEVVKGKEKYFL